mmetsp:Transcript_27084/g.76212  ORF Transcript_27084/g.76212 Transcript_27084/m.76212 type:complete len:240 (-) Transcript_27084:164-883(-)|eukprot:CAMPEP_0119560786 /NCGR_PEP_ID=MMETSP1352-20130426/15864_1 /TAXON_ID=265584 /ORGANISM="Stauroneis constricta, Strain CCMP1120" /LENGTH=239 /DNA_ID=CAMNT_0007608839 /DNA_START=138 /DNA_END=857 /DNA_ORIENTATION=-
MPLTNKKRKAADAKAASTTEANNKKKKSIIATETSIEFSTYTLEDIRQKVIDLCKRMPTVPNDEFGHKATPKTAINEPLIKKFASELQFIMEEFNLISGCVGAATYKWGTDRSGAADQNLTLLVGEFSSAQDTISSAVSSRLSNVLAPMVELVVDKVIVTKDGDDDNNDNDATKKETRQNVYIRKGDGDFIALCHTILARNAVMIRQLMLSQFEKVLKCIKDYLKAQKNDNQADRGFAY